MGGFSHPMAGVTILKLETLQPVDVNTLTKSKKPLERPTLRKDVSSIILTDEIPTTLKGTINIGLSGQAIRYEQMGIEKNLSYLEQLFNLFSRLINIYPQVIILGSDIIPLLRQIIMGKHPLLHPLALQWLSNIGAETTARFSSEVLHLLCPTCLTWCSSHTVKTSQHYFVTYFGCRSCHQSRDFLKGHIIAVVDHQMRQEYVQHKDIVYVNWLAHQKIFDFSEVEFVRATDEDAERLAVQIGNDTDIIRHQHYHEMRCTIKSSSHLSENSLRILKRTFKYVDIQSKRLA